MNVTHKYSIFTTKISVFSCARGERAFVVPYGRTKGWKYLGESFALRAEFLTIYGYEDIWGEEYYIYINFKSIFHEMFTIFDKHST